MSEESAIQSIPLAGCKTGNALLREVALAYLRYYSAKVHEPGDVQTLMAQQKLDADRMLRLHQNRCPECLREFVRAELKCHKEVA